LIKYWGNRDDALRIPANQSLSFNLKELVTETNVYFDPNIEADHLTINGQVQTGSALQRVSGFLEIVRGMAGIGAFARVDSRSNFPMGAGIASSAAAFAALAAAASSAAGLALDESGLSRLARRGSGSAARSVPAGFVRLYTGDAEESAYGASIAPADHWDLVDCICVVSQEHKPTGSTAGHKLAETSPLQAPRVQDAERRIDICQRAILEKDFDTLAEISEVDSNMMHAVMMTSQPRLIYWEAATVALMRAVHAWRQEGLPVFYTIDAGPNVHVITRQPYLEQAAARIRTVPGIKDVLMATVGGGVRQKIDDYTLS
jgi:diphosphomevalonate decarboxylase